MDANGFMAVIIVVPLVFGVLFAILAVIAAMTGS